MPSYAALCGASPVQASSGKTVRLRLNRGGDRQANAALYRIALSRLRWDPQTRAYLAREIYQLICEPAPDPTAASTAA